MQAAVVVPADPLDDRQLELVARAPDAIGDQLGLERVHERFRERVVVGVAGRSERREDPVVVEGVVEVVAGVLGGFQRSSQRSIRRGCDGQAKASVGSSRAAGDAITGSATGRSTRTPAALLGGDCARRAQRRGRCRGGRVAGGGRPVVSGGWRDAADQSGSAVRAVPVVRRARGDRGAAGRWLWGARGCAPAGSLAVDDLAGVAAQRRDAQRPLGLPGDDGAVACRSARQAAQAGQAGGQRSVAWLCAGTAGWPRATS